MNLRDFLPFFLLSSFLSKQFKMQPVRAINKGVKGEGEGKGEANVPH